MQVNHYTSLPPGMPRTSFCSALGKSIGHVIAGLFYECGSSFASHGSNLERKCLLLSKYHYFAAHPLISKIFFGTYFVAPSVNMESKDSLTQPADLDRQAKMMQRARQLAGKNIQFDDKSISDQKNTKGVFLAASLKFGQIFMRKMHSKGLSPEAAFAKAAGRFTRGASKKTCLKYNVQKAVDVCLGAKARSLNVQDKTKIQTKKREQAVANLFKLKTRKSVAELDRKTLKTQFKNLPNGSYEVGLYGKNLHSIFIHKEDHRVFFFDPTYGSALMPTDQHIKALSRIMWFTGVKKLDFTPIELKPNYVYLSSGSAASSLEVSSDGNLIDYSAKLSQY